MGYYIQGPHRGKAGFIVKEYGGEVVGRPRSLSDVPEGKALVIVVNNGPFDAAALAYSERELEDFVDPDDLRPKTFVILDKEKAYTLAGYVPPAEAEI